MEILKKVPTFKYLDLTLDQTLNYNHHISSIIRTVLHKMTLLAKMKKYLYNDVALLIYKTMLLPYLDYAILEKIKNNLLNNKEIRTRAHDAPLFNITIPRCEAYEHSVSYSGGTEWNNLDPEIWNTDSYLAFKYLQKTNRHLPLSHIELED